MKVRELIEKLQKVENQDGTVLNKTVRWKNHGIIFVNINTAGCC